MLKALVIVNVLLTVPFGVAALISPEPLFMQFGVELSSAGALVARGYAATLIGYGVLLWGLRTSDSPTVTRYVLLSLVLFNGIEAVVQGVAAYHQVASGAIYANVVIHFLVMIWAAYALAFGAINRGGTP